MMISDEKNTTLKQSTGHTQIIRSVLDPRNTLLNNLKTVLDNMESDYGWYDEEIKYRREHRAAIIVTSMRKLTFEEVTSNGHLVYLPSMSPTNFLIGQRIQEGFMGDHLWNRLNFDRSHDC